MPEPMPHHPSQLIDGPADAPASLLFAHGAGAPMDSPFMQAMALGLAERGWRVIRFEFPYMARARRLGRRQGPDRQPVLLESWREQVAAADGPLFIGGKSMGGRMASLVLDELATTNGVLGCLCFGYPFHPPGRPGDRRTTHLLELHTPCLILQGERDSFGRREEVESYGLPDPVQLAWLPDGDHSFRPTRRSGLSEEGNLRQAVAAADQFMALCCRDRLAG